MYIIISKNKFYTETSGTGNLILNSIPDIQGNVLYSILDETTFETGLGFLENNILVRNNIFDSSNGKSFVDFPGYSKKIFIISQEPIEE